MLTSRDGLVKVRANIAGEVEIRAKVGQMIAPGQILAVVEGDLEIESLSVRSTSQVEEICAECGTEVEESTLLMLVREVPDD